MGNILVVFLFLFCHQVFAGGIESLVEKYSGKEGLNVALWGMDIRYSSGKKIYSLNADKNLVPASIMKIFVTAAALDKLGPQYRFRTEIYASGPVKDGILHGDLLIRGLGDMTLGSANFGSSPKKVFTVWLSEIRKNGIKEIKGDIKVDDSLFNGYQSGSWAWEDIANYYAARPSALSINDNLYRIYFQPGSREGEKASFLRFEPEMPLEIENMVLTGPEKSGDNSYIFGLPWYDRIVVKGYIQKQKKEFQIKGAIGDGALYCALSFAKYLSIAGIKFAGRILRTSGGADYKNLQLLYSDLSPELSEIVKVTNKKSFNFYAESLLRMLPFKTTGAAGEKEGFSELRKFLEKCGIDPRDICLADASGLSRTNCARASDFTKVLNFVAGTGYFSSFYQSLVYPGDPMAGGHIKMMGVGSNFENNIRIKSGSLSRIRSYSGYLKTRKGRLISFASIINNYSVNPAELNRIHEELFSLLYENY